MSKSKESRQQRRKRLESEGRWKAFLTYRKHLASRGASVKEAAQTADLAFAEGTSGAPEGFERLLTPWAASEAEAVANKSETLAAEKVTVGDPDRGAGPDGMLALFRLKGWDELIAAGRGKQSDERSIAQWVMANLLVKLKDIDLEEVPSAEAVTLLHWTREAGENRSEFITKIWKALMPTRSRVDMEAELILDDRTTEQLLAGFIDEFDNSQRLTETLSEGQSGDSGAVAIGEGCSAADKGFGKSVLSAGAEGAAG